MTSQPVLCLNMIVKNESPIVGRLVASVAPHVGYYVVCDTGSTDDTVERIRAGFSVSGVSGEVHSIPFVNFGQTRNEALERGRSSTGSFDYFLLADADMELVVDDPSFARNIAGLAYSVKQEDGSVAYYNTRLIRRDIAAAYVGATHEYLNVGGKATRLDGVRFLDHACGSNRANKIARDTELLLATLRDDPDNGRAMFYLAQTCRDAKQLREAAAWYELRTRAGGFAEEVWYARYQLALCYAELGDERRFVSECLRAYAERPTRAEPLYALARHYRTQELAELAMLFAEAAARVPYPADDALFIEEEIYRTGILEELSIGGLSTADQERRKKGRASCFTLTISPTAPEQRLAAARRNSVSYALSAAELFGELDFRRLSVPTREGYYPLNPSIASGGGLLRCILRTSNYTLEDGQYIAHDPNGIIRTENYFLRLTDALEVEAASPMQDRSPNPSPGVGPVRGYEDCRLFFLRDAWWASATVLDRNPKWTCEIALLALDGDGQIRDVRILPSPNPGRHEKNWVPLVRDDDLFFVYTIGPTVVIHCDPVTGTLEEVSLTHPTLRLDGLRGGSQAIPARGGWLYVTHEAVDFGRWRRTYLHRFVYLDDCFAVRGLTDPFYFLWCGREFCAGLTLDPSGDLLIVSFGGEDREARLATLSLDRVFSQLRAL